MGEPNGKFLKSQAVLYLDLKTQAFISALKDYEDDSNVIPQGKKQELLNLVFPANLPHSLIKRRTGAPEDTITNPLGAMTPSERDFVERCDRRKENLMQVTNFNDLIINYDWNHFIKELLDYCNKNMGLIIWGRKGRGKSPLFSFDYHEFDNQVMYASGVLAPENSADDSHNSGVLDAVRESSFFNANVNAGNNSNNNNENSADNNDDTDAFSPNLESSTQPNNDATPSGTAPATTTSTSSIDSRLQQSVIHAAVANSAISSNNVSGNVHKKLKPKRVWSKEEEATLLEGLQEVGPSWSKILDLYGPGGKVNEGLKNRTQVQLKDKARNWKLQYLKNNKPLPDYLEKVTGNIDKVYKSKKKARIMQQQVQSQHDTDKANDSQQLQSSIDPAVATPSDNLTSNGLFGPAAEETTGYDPNLEANM